MTIEIKQRFVPIGMHSMWQQEPFETTVWRYPDQLIRRVICPPDYMPGLLVGYVDGDKLNLADLDAALATIGTSRQDIVTFLRGAV